MTSRNTYTVVPESIGQAYGVLLKVIGSLATEFGVIVRSEHVRLSASASQLLQRLDPYLISVTDTQTWPGTQLVGERRSIRRSYRSEPESLGLLIHAAHSMSDWVNPNLPEDLHFVRADGSVALGSIAQENDVWLELSGEEADDLRALLPQGFELRAEQTRSAGP